MNNLKKCFVTTSVVALLSACATSPDNLDTTYVSPLKYEEYTCKKIALEMEHVSQRTVVLYQDLDKKAQTDAVQMGVGLVIFWPMLFFLEGGDGPEAAEYSNLKGEFEALRTASVQKQCDPRKLPKSPEEIIKEKAEEKKKNQS